MNIKKIILKSIYFTPLYFLLIIILDFVFKKNLSLGAIILMSIIISVFTIVSNVFDYNYYNDIVSNDYLESNHSTEIEYSVEKWESLRQLDKIDSKITKRIKESETEIEYLIVFNIIKGQLNSKLNFKIEGNKILIEIKKVPISFLPDKANNYKILRRLIYNLKN